MNIMKSTLLVTVAFYASDACAREHKLDIQIKDDTSQVTASIEQGKFLIRQREYGLAVNNFRKILRSDPDNASVYSAMAIAYDGLGRPDLARRNFELALAYAPLDKKHYRNLARHLTIGGERGLAKKVMRDFELARQDLREIQKKALVAMDIADRENEGSLTPQSPNFVLNSYLPEKPSIPPEKNVEISGSAILQRRPGISRVAAGDTGLNAGNMDYDGYNNTDSHRKTGPTASTLVLEKPKIEDLYEVLADVFESLGEPELAAENRLNAQNKGSASLEKISEPESLTVGDLDGWLAKLAVRQSSKTVMAPEPRSGVAANSFSGAYLVRQSLGEVLLKTRHPSGSKENRQLRRAARPEALEQGTSRNLMIASNRVEDRQYFAAVRSVLEIGSLRSFDANPTVSQALIMKEVDLAMADLRQKRLNRLPRVDRGPSQEMQNLAPRLHQYADLEQSQQRFPKTFEHMNRSFADYDLCVRIHFRPGRQCIA